RRQGSPLDNILTMTASLLYSVPVFWLGLIAIIAFGVKLHWLPTSGMNTVMGPTSGWAFVLDLVRHLLLPASTLMLVWVFPTFYRIARSSVLEVLREDFMVTARAKGLPQRVIFFRHALRNALLPTVTMIGLSLGLAVSGALLTETVFSWPGMGRLMYEGIFRRDYPLLMGIFIFTSISVVIVSLLTDILYRVLDPRVDLN
ncbi:MAG: transporter permease, partial [Firmicutes bacterium]|nr:transporter permease [Bacillota bacterium]